jgi:hypothetical protein
MKTELLALTSGTLSHEQNTAKVSSWKQLSLSRAMPRGPKQNLPADGGVPKRDATETELALAPTKCSKKKATAALSVGQACTVPAEFEEPKPRMPAVVAIDRHACRDSALARWRLQDPTSN